MEFKVKDKVIHITNPSQMMVIIKIYPESDEYDCQWVTKNKTYTERYSSTVLEFYEPLKFL